MENRAQKNQYRVITFLKRAELDFLDELEKDIYFSHGIHIPRTKLIEEIIETFKIQGAVDKKGLEEGLIKMFKGMEAGSNDSQEKNHQ